MRRSSEGGATAGKISRRYSTRVWIVETLTDTTMTVCMQTSGKELGGREDYEQTAAGTQTDDHVTVLTEATTRSASPGESEADVEHSDECSMKIRTCETRADFSIDCLSHPVRFGRRSSGTPRLCDGSAQHAAAWTGASLLPCPHSTATHNTG